MENTKLGQNKFWEGTFENGKINFRWGKISGGVGHKTSTYANVSYFLGRVRDKLSKGYVIVESNEAARKILKDEKLVGFTDLVKAPEITAVWDLF